MKRRATGPAGFAGRLFGQSDGQAEPELNTDGIGAHCLPLLAPPMDQAQRILIDHIARLGDAGALDEGSGHVLDATIEAWVRQWAETARAAHEMRMRIHNARKSRLELEVTNYNQQLDELSDQIATVNAEVLTLDAEIRAAMAPKASRTEARPRSFRNPFRTNRTNRAGVVGSGSFSGTDTVDPDDLANLHAQARPAPESKTATRPPTEDAGAHARFDDDDLSPGGGAP